MSDPPPASIPAARSPRLTATRLFALAAPYRASLALAALVTLIASITTLSIPWFAALLLGSAVGDQTTGLAFAVAGIVGALTLTAALNFAVSLLSGRTAAAMLADLREQIYRHLQSLPVSFHELNRRGDLLALSTYEIARLSNFLSSVLVALPSQLLIVAGSVILMMRIDARLGLLVLVLVPLFYITLKLVGRHLRRLYRKSQQAEADIVAHAEESLEMLPAIKAFTREEIEAEKYRLLVKRSRDLSVRELAIEAALSPSIGLVAGIAAVVVLATLGQDVQAGTTSPTELFSFLFYAALLTKPVSSLAHVYGQTQGALGTFQRLDGIFRVPAEAGYSAKSRTPRRVDGKIVFDKVSFSYPGREAVLRSVDLVIAAGETVALTGANGAGKSTIVNLLLRFHEPDSGQIRIDNEDLKDFDVRDLRANIGLVSQQVLLKNGTIAENVALGMPDATLKDIELALDRAQAAPFVSALKDGLHTQIGDQGIRLSGGQRQRLALARALIKDPPILILDEATAMFDPEGESLLVADLKSVMAGRTLILITHRPASLVLADRILRVVDGQICPA